MVSFGGWSMPVQYPTGILAEHRAVRTACGVFDISHMGQFIVSGPSAKTWLNSLFTNNLERIGSGQSQYGFLLNDEGGVIDDLIVYQYAEGEYFLVVNASKIEEDYAWMQGRLTDGVEFTNRSDRFAALAVQGPRAPEIFAAFFGPDEPLPERLRVRSIEREGLPFFVARTGYTGEDGFEWFFPARAAAVVWDELLAKGAAHGLIACGLGARDSLRLEVCYPLNGSDLSATRTPLDAGLGFFVDLEKGAFPGRDALRLGEGSGRADRAAGCLPHDGRQPPAAAALPGVRSSRRLHRRDDERRHGPQPRIGGHWDGLPAGSPGQTRASHRDRHPRPAFPGGRGKEAPL